MCKKLSRIWSIILVLVMLVQLLPAQALAAQMPVSAAPAASTPASGGEVLILEELTDKRTEFSKEYLLSNGLHMASVYSNAVHYEDNGQWKDIDNTLLAVGTGSQAAYTNTAGLWDVRFPQELSAESGITVTKDGHSLTFYMSGQLRAPVLEEISPITAGDTEFTLTAAEPAQAQLVELNSAEAKAEAEHPETVLDKLRSRLQYPDVCEDTSIVYDLTSNQLKESVILESYDEGLRGFQFTLDTGDLIPVLTDSSQILLMSKDSKEPVMVMPAPYLLDSADGYSSDVGVELVKKGDQYILLYTLPRSWLAAQERQWPVILDPVVSGQVTFENVEDRCVYSEGYAEPTFSLLQCGYGGPGLGIMRFYMRFVNLPEIASSNVIVNATVQLNKLYDYGNTSPVEVHRAVTPWSEETLTWTENDDEHFDSKVEDFAVCKEVDFYRWDITDLVRSWYEGDNYGMVFKCPQSVEESTTQNMQRFTSTDFLTHNIGEKPMLNITFRNNNGLESYWDYTSLSAGRAGAGYINNYSGNLVWTRGDMGFGGCVMPVSISHVYNSNDSENNDFGMGNGWRTNYNQRILADESYYIWEDGDGTAHYFHPNGEENTYIDEDGLELKLTLTGTDDLACTITDKNGNVSRFNEKGYLCELENNQATSRHIRIAYSENTEKIQISTITDSADRVYSFKYFEASGLLEQITYMVEESGEAKIYYNVSYGYDGNNLTTVTDNDGKVIRYTYQTLDGSQIPNLLHTARDIDSYTLTFDYTSGSMAKVSSVLETYSNTKQGGSLAITYQQNQTTLTDHNGNVQILQFNNLGNTVSVQDDQGRAQYAGYAINDSTEASEAEPTEKANQLILSSKLQNTVVNLLGNSSFENGHTWSATGEATVAHAGNAGYIGSGAMVIQSRAAGTASGAASASIPVEAGKVYTFSAFVKTAGPSVCLALSDGSTTVTGQALHPTSENAWTRLQVSYTAPTSGTVTAQVLTEEAGNVYVDGVQLEQAPTASRYNLMANGDFRDTSAWNSAAGRITADSTAAPALSSQAYKLSGVYNAASRLSQTVQVSGSEGTCFVLGGWAKGDSVPLGEHYGVDRQFGIIATFYNGDAQVGESQSLSFNPYLGIDYWQSASAPLAAPGDFTHIVVELAYDYNSNEAIFDGIQLFREEFGSSFAYDSNGNVASATDIQGARTVYRYDETTNDLLQVWLNVLPGEVTEDDPYPTRTADMTYTYDTHHNVTASVTLEGITTTYEYDAYGNVTEVSVTGPGSTVPMVTSSTYTEDGNRLLSTTDAAGNVTRYGYHAATNVLEWVQYPNDTEATRTEYTYEEDTYRVEGVSADIDSDTTLSVGYGYENDLLKAIITPSTTYNFTHGDFGLRTAIRVGNQTLASYEYTNDRNFYLKKLAYGNADMVEYTYDDQGRVISQTYENGDTLTYSYDNIGALATVTDSATGRTTTYYYDLTDRLMQYVEAGEEFSHSVGYGYNDENQLTALVETINGTAYTTEYAYDDSRRLSSVTNEGSDQTLTYDGYGRVSRKELTRDGRTVLTVEYAYRNPSETSTTGQIASITIGTNGASRSYSYTYDANGNILSVSDGSHTTSYAYDKAGQLLRENNEAAGKTWAWEYDDAGNILSKKEYAYTTGSLGEALDTVTYAYNNDNWGDLLTSYDGQTITYDQIGNPLNDGTWEYTWEHGRQLSSMTDGTVTLDFQYNADGIRTRKTVITASDHTHAFQTRVVAPTCTENGYTLHECVCGYSWQSAPVVSTGHTFVATEVEATCTAHGYTLQECECGYGYQEGTQGHTFTDTVVAPTAEENGYTLHECTCGYSYQDTPVAALGITNSSASGNATNTKVYDYVYNGSSLSYLTVTTNQYGAESADPETLYFGNGTVTYNGTVYYYVTNLQGDVVAIIDADGNPKVQYTYDAWGKILSISGPMADTLGAVNPITYRGYVYDSDTDLYYLQSRYYDPAVGRFINADALVSTGQGILGNNMFAYCLNCPVCRKDIGGATSVACHTEDVDHTDDDKEFAGGKISNPNQTNPSGAVSNGGASSTGKGGHVSNSNPSQTSSSSATTSGGNTPSIPKAAYDVLEHVDSHNGSPPAGYKGGGSFANDMRSGSAQLPENYGPYKKYDIYPKIPGLSRGTERIVIGNGVAFYTPDHYATFIQMR